MTGSYLQLCYLLEQLLLDVVSLENNLLEMDKIMCAFSMRSVASLPYMEWKPKSTQKLNVNSNDGGKSAVSISSSADDDSSRRKTEASDLPGKLSEVTLSTDEHVIIAQHLQVPEADRCRLTFGSFGVDVESSNGSGPEFQVFRDELEQKNDHSRCLYFSRMTNLLYVVWSL